MTPEYFWADTSPRFQESPKEPENIKTKILSTWNNVCNGWSIKVKTNFSKYEPIWLLGKQYGGRLRKTGDQTEEHGCPSWVAWFRADVASRIWMTYRRGFPSVSGSTSFTSDTGWGCMLRAGQMLLAEGLNQHFLGRDWRWIPRQGGRDECLHRMIISWFADTPGAFSPLSLHQMVSVGQSIGKMAGDWYGPATVTQILRISLQQAGELDPKLERMRAYVAQDLSVYFDDVIQLCTSNTNYIEIGEEIQPTSQKQFEEPDQLECYEFTEPLSDESSGSLLSLPDSIEQYPELYPDLTTDLGENMTENYRTPYDSTVINSEKCDSKVMASEKTTLYPDLSDMKEKDISQNWHPLFLYIPLRLGGEKLNPVYIPLLKSFFTWRNCLGVIGGKPKHALYFVGWQGDNLIYLDPHYCQKSVCVDDPNFSLDSYHCSSPRKISFHQMDPSAAVGFYCPTYFSFLDLINKVKQVEGEGTPPLFQFCPGKRLSSTSNSKSKDKVTTISQKDTGHCTEYVFL